MNITSTPPKAIPQAPIAAAPAAAPAAPAPTDSVVAVPQGDDFLHKLITLKDSADAQKFQKALEAEIKATAGATVEGWSTPHVEKASFPFQVQKQARIYAPIAAAQVSQNMSGVIALLANPEIDKAILMGVETRLNPDATPTMHDLNDPDFRLFYNSLRTGATSRSQYEFSGTLVNVGWGSGDHVNVSSDHLPVGPNTLSSHLAGFVTRALTKPA